MKTVILTIILMFALQANSVDKQYTATIEVKSTKADGKPWDFAGGAPDILVFVDSKAIAFSKSCKNRYKCSVTFSTKKQEVYLEIYDKDLKESDLIAKGNCKIGNECVIDSAKVKIEQKGE